VGLFLQPGAHTGQWICRAYRHITTLICQMTQYNVNKCIFNRRLKSSLLTARSHKQLGNELQTDRHMSQHRGTTRFHTMHPSANVTIEH